MSNNNEGSTPALGDAKPANYMLPRLTIPSRASAIGRSSPLCGITAFAARRLCGLRIKDMQSRQGVLNFRVKRNRGCPVAMALRVKVMYRHWARPYSSRTISLRDCRNSTVARVHLVFKKQNSFAFVQEQFVQTVLSHRDWWRFANDSSGDA
jgi:hypothetical protein